MFFREALPFVKEFVEQLDQGLQASGLETRLSHKQKFFLCFCLMGILVTNSVCWARFERASLGDYPLAALSWMFRHSPIPWNPLFHMGVAVILRKYNIADGVLVIDDTDHKRAKQTSRIYRTYKVFDKKTGGYFNGQTIVFVVLVADGLTLPAGFAFYRPDPVLQAWEKEEKKLISRGICKKERPPKPQRDPNYPTKEDLAKKLLKEFKEHHPEVKIKAVDGDNHYSTASFMDSVASLFQCQVISCMKTNQKVRFRGKQLAVQTYFEQHPPVKHKLRIRGGEKVEVFIGSARLHVPSHSKKRFVIALRYTDQDEFTYVLASDMAWRTLDIIETWTLRWLVEVFIEDFKSYEGCGQLAKQQGEEGSSRGLALSLLCDLCLFLHPSQVASFENKQPAFTVGSLLRKARAEALITFLSPLMSDAQSQQHFETLGKKIEEVFELKPSKKHMSGRQLGRMEPSPSLKYRNQAA